MCLFLFALKPKIKKNWELSLTIQRLMHTLNLYSSLTTDIKDMVKILVRVLQNESTIHSLWMGYCERLKITEDNNIGSVQYVLVFSQLGKMTTEI